MLDKISFHKHFKMFFSAVVKYFFFHFAWFKFKLSWEMSVSWLMITFTTYDLHSSRIIHEVDSFFFTFYCLKFRSNVKGKNFLTRYFNTGLKKIIRVVIPKQALFNSLKHEVEISIVSLGLRYPRTTSSDRVTS